MTRLLNGRPMSELVCDGRTILVRESNGDTFIAPAHSSLLNPLLYPEWADIIKPEPKPDANGWWKFSEVKPEKGKITEFANPGEKTNYVGEYQNEYQTRYSHWRPWTGPVDK